MLYAINYYSPRVLEDVKAWPVGVLADYNRATELLAQRGPATPMPHSRAMGDGLFELRLRGREGSGRALYCFLPERRVVILGCFMKTTRATPGREIRRARERMASLQRGR
jgi:phage-related protein